MRPAREIDTGKNVIFHGVFQVEVDNFKSPMATIEYENGTFKNVHVTTIIMTDVKQQPDNQLTID